MRKSHTLLEVEKIKIPKPDISNENISLGELAVQARRKNVNRLRLRGYTNQEIAMKMNCSLSLIEKINHQIRESGRKWYENECINDYCESLQDSIILCDNFLEDLQIIYEESDNQLKIKILNKILDLEEHKKELFSQTKAVQNFIEVI